MSDLNSPGPSLYAHYCYYYGCCWLVSEVIIMFLVSCWWVFISLFFFSFTNEHTFSHYYKINQAKIWHQYCPLEWAFRFFCIKGSLGQKFGSKVTICLVAPQVDCWTDCVAVKHWPVGMGIQICMRHMFGCQATNDCTLTVSVHCPAMEAMFLLSLLSKLLVIFTSHKMSISYWKFSCRVL